MSLFNDVQGPLEPVLEFHSRFDGMFLDMSRSKIILPPILLVMLFLRACTHVIPIFLISFDLVTRISKLQRSTPSSKMSAIMMNSSSLATKRSLVVVPPRLLLRMLTGMVKNGRPPSNGSHPMLRRVSRLARNAPLLVQVSAPFAIVPRNHDTSLPTAPSSRN